MTWHLPSGLLRLSACLTLGWCVLALLVPLPARAQFGFGRFGRENTDGLLTLNVTPDRLDAPSPVSGFSVRIAPSTVTSSVVSIDQTAKVLSLAGGGTGSATSVRYTLLYPGLSAEFGTQASLGLSTSNVTVERIETTTGTPAMHGVLLTASSGSFVPIVIAFRDGFRPATVSRSGTTLTISDAQPLGEVRFLTPIGMTRFSSSASSAQRADLRQRSIDWLRRGLPTLMDRSAAYDRTTGRVTITERFSTANGSPIAPVPPVLAFALENGYPATVSAPLVKPGVRTKYGPFAFVEGDTAQVTLPVPPLDEFAFLRLNGETTRRTLLNDLVSRLGASWATNAVDLGYVGLTPAQMSWPHLDTTRRNNLTSAWSTYLPLAWRFPPYPPGDTRITWREQTEPFTGLNYWWTYKIDGPQGQALDIEWGNMLPVYGLYKYCQFTGDWAFAQTRWNRVKEVLRFTNYADDWAWMTNANGDMGYSTGTGDPLTAAFAGQVAALKLARALGDTTSETELAVRAARVMVPAVARLWFTDWARAQGYISSTEQVLGFWERNGTFTTGNMSESASDPWSSTNLLSGNGVIPEFFAAVHAASAGLALDTYEQRYATAYPNWANGAFVYPFTTTYGGNSVYVVFPHIYARHTLGEATANLWGYVDSSQANRGTTSWIAPPVLAALLSRDTPLVLTEWRPARLVDAVYDNATRRATLDFSVTTPTNWTLTARCTGEPRPSALTIGGTAVPWALDGQTLTTTASVSGSFRVEVQMVQPPARVEAWGRY
jgi:hypothetical protein